MGRAVWRGGWKGSQRIPRSLWQGRRHLRSPSGGHLSGFSPVRSPGKEDPGVLVTYTKFK